MQIDTTDLDGVLLLTPTLIGDDRGFFYESWNGRRFAEALGLDESEAPTFSQDNHSRSSHGVLRGLHYQLPPHPQGKLVRCVVGEIFDVAVDLRRASATYGQWYGTVLSASNHRQLWIPAGFAHGFLTLSAQADVLYKASGYWNRGCERSLLWNDPRLAIAWPLEGLIPQLAAKDAAAVDLSAAEAAGDVFP
ncbi:MAG: dTDP-4-dehydrorhamnose 3,5-epimerase [Cyanobacteriota bacterium]|nr:dTDP-4-dehydrorhamnose 3,5-epimerase [Cyanobacteriota bacterium]